MGYSGLNRAAGQGCRLSSLSRHIQSACFSGGFQGRRPHVRSDRREARRKPGREQRQAAMTGSQCVPERPAGRLRSCILGTGGHASRSSKMTHNLIAPPAQRLDDRWDPAQGAVNSPTSGCISPVQMEPHVMTCYQNQPGMAGCSRLASASSVRVGLALAEQGSSVVRRKLASSRTTGRRIDRRSEGAAVARGSERVSARLASVRTPWR